LLLVLLLFVESTFVSLEARTCLSVCVSAVCVSCCECVCVACAAEEEVFFVSTSFSDITMCLGGANVLRLSRYMRGVVVVSSSGSWVCEDVVVAVVSFAPLV